MTVYADVLFLINFSLDYVSLYITGRLMSRPMTTLRLCSASAIGAVYAVLALFIDAPEPIYIAVTLFVSAVMCLCAYRCTGVAGTVGPAVLLFAVGCALGGAMTAVYSLGAGYRDSEANDGGAGVTVAVAAVAASVVAFACRMSSRRRGTSARRARITVDGRTVTVSALVDSGNMLRDPVSGRPALVISADTAKKLLPEDAVALASSEKTSAALDGLSVRTRSRVRILPAENVNGEALLLGYRPDSVFVENAKGMFRPFDCILAVSVKKDGFGECSAVLPAEIS